MSGKHVSKSALLRRVGAVALSLVLALSLVPAASATGNGESSDNVTADEMNARALQTLEDEGHKVKQIYLDDSTGAAVITDDGSLWMWGGSNGHGDYQAGEWPTKIMTDVASFSGESSVSKQPRPASTC